MPACRCPSCGADIVPGLRSRHSVGPWRIGRWVGHLAWILGLVTTLVVAFTGSMSWGLGYGAFLAGVVVWAMLHRLAAMLPRTVYLACPGCGWHGEAAGAVWDAGRKSKG